MTSRDWSRLTVRLHVLPCPAQVTLDEADVLMKYVYRGLTRPDNSAFLLKLHAQLVEKSGLGALSEEAR